MTAFFDWRLSCLAVFPGHLNHVFREIDEAAFCVLFVNRRDKHFISEHKLILDVAGNFVFRVIEAQRAEHHFIFKASLDEFAVNVWKKCVAERKNALEIIGFAESITFLISGIPCRVVSHERCENAEREPAEYQIA